jgi:hypothetical protein
MEPKKVVVTLQQALSGQGIFLLDVPKAPSPKSQRSQVCRDPFLRASALIQIPRRLSTWRSVSVKHGEDKSQACAWYLEVLRIGVMYPLGNRCIYAQWDMVAAQDNTSMTNDGLHEI